MPLALHADLVNGLFEFVGGLFVLNHCRALLRDRELRGVSVVSCLFFPGWGLWNLYFYPSLDQWYSFAGGAFLAAANVLWVGLMFRFRRRRCDNPPSCRTPTPRPSSGTTTRPSASARAATGPRSSPRSAPTPN